MNESQERLNAAKSTYNPDDVAGALAFLKWWRDGEAAIMYMADVEAGNGNHKCQRTVLLGDEPKAYLDNLWNHGRLGTAACLLESVSRHSLFRFSIEREKSGYYYHVWMMWQ